MSTDTQTTDQPQIVSAAALRAQARPYITNPATGNTYHARRVTMADLVLAGSLPEEYVALMEAADAGEAARAAGVEKTVDDLSVREALKATKAGAMEMRIYVMAALISPKVVDDPKGDDEIEYTDLPESDRTFIYRWAKGMADSAPVELNGGGVTTAGQLENFPAGERPLEPAGARGADESVGAAG